MSDVDHGAKTLHRILTQSVRIHGLADLKGLTDEEWADLDPEMRGAMRLAAESVGLAVHRTPRDEKTFVANSRLDSRSIRTIVPKGAKVVTKKRAE